MDYKSLLKKREPWLYEMPAGAAPQMKVTAQVYLSEKLLDEIAQDKSLEQLANVAGLPGVVEPVIAMPDMHEGYGFPIGGVAATQWPHGVISPGGVGYDINCGVRLLISDLKFGDVEPQLEKLATEFMRAVPSGTGRGGRIKLTDEDLDNVLRDGVAWCLKQGLGVKGDDEHLEENGHLAGADPSLVSPRAKSRGRDQLGTLGSGNHFLEIQKVDRIIDPETAKAFGLFADQVVVAIHCGSRGLGHQVCTDYVRRMLPKLAEYKIELADRELACAPADSPEGRDYLGAMAAAANFAWANRQVITHHVRLEWEKIFGAGHTLGTLYDVCHNIAKLETHSYHGSDVKLLVHRKGATRAFPGQPVIIPGTMGTASYVLVGTEEAMRKTFGSVCHGAGRRMSRHEAKREVKGDELRHELEGQGIVVRCFSNTGLAEEAPLAYKDVDEVVNIVEAAGLAKKVARLRPIAVIKGE